MTLDSRWTQDKSDQILEICRHGIRQERPRVVPSAIYPLEFGGTKRNCWGIT